MCGIPNAKDHNMIREKMCHGDEELGLPKSPWPAANSDNLSMFLLLCFELYQKARDAPRGNMNCKVN